MKTIIYIIIGTIIGLAIGISLFEASTPFGGTMELNRFSTASSSVVTVATSSTTVLTANSQRLWARIDNDSNRTIYCDTTASTTTTIATGRGVRIDSGEYFVIDPLNLYVGVLRCIASTSSASISVIEE